MKVRRVDEVLTSLEVITGHAWRVEDTGGGCEVFYSETLGAIVTLDAGINYDRDAGGVFDSSVDRMNYDLRDLIEEGVEDPATVGECSEPWHLVTRKGDVSEWECESPEFTALTLSEIFNYLEGSVAI